MEVALAPSGSVARLLLLCYHRHRHCHVLPSEIHLKTNQALLSMLQLLIVLLTPLVAAPQQWRRILACTWWAVAGWYFPGGVSFPPPTLIAIALCDHTSAPPHRHVERITKGQQRNIACEAAQRRNTEGTPAHSEDNTARHRAARGKEAEDP
ncbi:hypothetical protein E2C01_088547 [Portunus trituberculatus]|uniref:Uncharacterized protein n=1 Tax=Portunus trituberculatus TaxID=210409 RepID=A0A5B7J9K2_PORTR|nr:hypothetical protein [Portunus trituberculatus]